MPSDVPALPHRPRCIPFIGIVAGLMMLVGGTPAAAQQSSLEDVDFHKDGLSLVVTYDLMGQRGEQYEVELLFSASAGEAFDFEPEAVSGDVGDNVRPGMDKQIRWNVLDDFPEGLQAANAQFKVLVDEQGGNALYWIGGALVAGGGGTAAAVLGGLFGGSSGGGGGGGSGGGGGDTIPPPSGPPN